MTPQRCLGPYGPGGTEWNATGPRTRKNGLECGQAKDQEERNRTQTEQGPGRTEWNVAEPLTREEKYSLQQECHFKYGLMRPVFSLRA